jgi:hypothetical protein
VAEIKTIIWPLVKTCGHLTYPEAAVRRKKHTAPDDGQCAKKAERKDLEKVLAPLF